MKFNKIGICSLLIIVFHLLWYTGLIYSEYDMFFKRIFPFYWIFMLILMLVSQQERNKSFWLFVLTTFVSGFVIQLLAVQTGAIFGEFIYGSNLGIELADVPVVMGIFWVLLIYSCGIFMKEFEIKDHNIRAGIGAVLITFLDFLIEPIATKFDLWLWTNLEVPFQNNIAWLGISFVMLRLFFLMPFNKVNPAASIYFVVQYIFFIALNLKLISTHF